LEHGRAVEGRQLLLLLLLLLLSGLIVVEVAGTALFLSSGDERSPGFSALFCGAATSGRTTSSAGSIAWGLVTLH
jgi:hypothetical protein